MRVRLVLGILMLELLLVASNPILGAEIKNFWIYARCDSYETGYIPNVDVYLDSMYSGNTGSIAGHPEAGDGVKVATTIGYHNVKLIKNGCAKEYNVLFDFDPTHKLYSGWALLDYCECV